MTRFLHGTTSPLSYHAVSTGLGAIKPSALLVGPFTITVQESLPEGVSITSIPGTTFESKLSLLHTILPSAEKEAAKTGESVTVCRERILRGLQYDNEIPNWSNRSALAIFAKAGQEPNFDGLCHIADPDLFLSAIAYLLNYPRELRMRLGFRDINKMPSNWVAKYKKSPESFPVLRGTYKAK
jgi:hypothetical protein